MVRDPLYVQTFCSVRLCNIKFGGNFGDPIRRYSCRAGLLNDAILTHCTVTSHYMADGSFHADPLTTTVEWMVRWTWLDTEFIESPTMSPKLPREEGMVCLGVISQVLPSGLFLHPTLR